MAGALLLCTLRWIHCTWRMCLPARSVRGLLWMMGRPLTLLLGGRSSLMLQQGGRQLAVRFDQMLLSRWLTARWLLTYLLHLALF